MERIKLDLVPSCIKPVLHASQYDIGRQWWIELLNNGVPYVLQEDDVVEYEIRKGDGLVVTGSIAYIPGATYVILVSTEQMCAIYGSNLGELKISSNGAEIGTGNFILDVEKATTGGEKSKSVIWDLQAQVDDCTQKALENIGAKGLPFNNEDTDLEATNTEDAIKEVNEKVNEKADSDSVYTKEEVNQLIDDLPEAMIFKGTLGVGGTIQTLPAASTSNEGYTYKVITDGTYAEQTAKAGDLFTSNGSEWVLIPSADEDNDTWRAIKVNGVEKLGNAISSGNVDFVDTTNVKAHFDADGNKISFALDGIDTSAQVDEKVAGIIDDTQASASKVYSSNKVNTIASDINDTLDYLIGSNIDITDLTVFPFYNANMNNSGAWSSVGSDSYKYYIVPIPETGCKLNFTTGVYGIYYAGLKSYTQPTAYGQVADVSDTWTGRIYTSDSNVSVDIPNDVNFVLVWTLFNNVDYTPSAFSITKTGTQGYIDTELAKKQDTLVSGTSIKTINGESVLGSGDISTKKDTDFMLMFKRIAVLGDSLASGELTWLDDNPEGGTWKPSEQKYYHGVDIYSNSWLTYICRTIEATPVHYSSGGKSTASWWNEFANTLAGDTVSNAYIIFFNLPA